MVCIALYLLPSSPCPFHPSLPLSFPDWRAEERECTFASTATAARHGGGFRGNAPVTADRGVRGEAGGVGWGRGRVRWGLEGSGCGGLSKVGGQRETQACVPAQYQVPRQWKNARKKGLNFDQPRPKDSPTLHAPLAHSTSVMLAACIWLTFLTA